METSPPIILQGLPAAPGIASGPAFVLERPAAINQPGEPAVPVPRPDPSTEWIRLEQARQAARTEIERLVEQARARLGQEQAAIFQAHLLFLDDSMLLEPVQQALATGRDLETAWQTTIENTAVTLESLDDPIFQARAADVRDVGQRVLRHLTGQADTIPQLDHPAIVLAANLVPSDTVQLNPEYVLAFCTAGGGPTSHVAILARAMNKPAVVGLGPVLLQIQAGTVLLVDGHAGTVEVDPSAERLAAAAGRQETCTRQQTATAQDALEPAITRDGRRIEVVANLGSWASIQDILASGAEGVGLLRTEFLFLDRHSPPSESEQAEAYGALAEALAGRPLILRTLDIGGDKPVPYVEMPREANPFLGLRGIRLTLKHLDLFTDQLRAILRAGARGRVLVMFPMVSGVDEVRAARALLDRARLHLEAEGVATNLAEIGVMVETPAAALLADQLAPEVDFFSLGTNDLTQYTLAVDRGNPEVATLADGLDPAVLRLIDRTVHAAHTAGRWVGVCGELAADLMAIPILVGLGVDELSAAPAAIPAIKAAVRRLSAEEAEQLARRALAVASASEVREVVKSTLHDTQ